MLLLERLIQLRPNMKKYLTPIFIIIFLGSVHFASAQVDCVPITKDNYNSCCIIDVQDQNRDDCRAYENGYSTPPIYVPGTVNSGSGGIDTGPMNNSSDPDGGVYGGKPQSGSAELSRCSQIRFLSLLDILIWVKCIINVAIIPLIFAAALVVFLWGVLKFMGTSDSTKREEGKKFIIAGLIGLFVMTSLWGIIKILSSTLGIESTVPLLQTTYLKYNKIYLY